MKFKIIGAPSRSPLAGKVEAYCRGLSDGCLVTIDEVARSMKRSRTHMQQVCARLDNKLRIKSGVQILYGNPKTIKAYREEMGL